MQNCKICNISKELTEFYKNIAYKNGYDRRCVSCYKEMRKQNNCKHNKAKGRCKECGGGQLCSHSKRKDYCVECCGSQICKHKKQKYSCKKCNGKRICEHSRHRDCCYQCGGNKICINCKMTRKYIEDYCAPCYYFLNPELEESKKNRVRKEHMINDLYKSMYPNFIWESQDKILPNVCDIKRRPDYFINYGTHCIILEIDENQHKNYNEQCEISRLNQISEVVNDLPTIYIRFNPDSYKCNGKTIEGCFSIKLNDRKLKMNKTNMKKRLKKVHVEVLRYSNYDNVKKLLQNNLIKQRYLFFDE
jgi:hypothetical protein